MKQLKELSVNIKFKFPIFAVGAELKSVFAIGYKEKIFLLENEKIEDEISLFDMWWENYNFLKREVGVKPRLIVSDLHPAYFSTKFASEVAAKERIKLVKVQHHYSHIISCMSENNLKDRCIGVVYDGTGYGVDGNLWGSEIFVVSRNGFIRKGHFDYLDIVSGDLSVREPYRVAIGFLYKNLPEYEKTLFWKKFRLHYKNYRDRFYGIKFLIDNNKLVKSCGMGRVFDVVAVLCGLGTENKYEAELPIKFESLASDKVSEVVEKDIFYDYKITNVKDCLVVDTKGLLLKVIEDVGKVDSKVISAKFHYTIVKVTMDIVDKVCEKFRIRKVVLSGGVFQNKILFNLIEQFLQKKGFKVFCHKKLPFSDYNIALGQCVLGNKFFLK